MKRFVFGILLCLLICSNAWAQRMAVGSDVANIRSGPGTDHAILWKAEKYYPVDIIKKTGKWYQIRDFEGDQGWIHASLLESIETVIAIKDNCNVRSGPGTTHRILFTIEKGIPFKVLKREKKWIHIEHADGDQGWIHGSLVW
jgi:SH3-like domain-containing protein